LTVGGHHLVLADWALAGEIILFAIGLLAVVCAIRRRLRAGPEAPILPPWKALPSDPILLVLFAIGGVLVVRLALLPLLKASHYPAEFQLVLIYLGFEVGALGGIALFYLTRSRQAPPPPTPPGIFRAGAGTFLLALPLVGATDLLWQLVLNLFHIAVEQQDVVSFFINLRGALAKGLMVMLAVVLAPMTEELVFRRGFFRYLRGRVPRWLALTGCSASSWLSPMNAPDGSASPSSRTRCSI
jgi:membrane protease YdiL (CAAX protease family)